MIFGCDVSKYNPVGTYNPRQFVIFNAEDPGIRDQIHAAITQRVPWGIYIWIYPASNVTSFAGYYIDQIRSLGAGEPPLGFWADYEQDGVTLDQLDAFFEVCDAKRVRSGYYGNDWRFNGHLPYLNRPFWLAGYPGANDGSFPGFQAMRSSRPVQLWQFTSTNGALDVDVVVDETWFNSLTQPKGASGDDDVAIMYISKKSDPALGIWVTEGVQKRHVLSDEWDWVNFIAAQAKLSPPPVIPITDQWWDSLPVAGVAVASVDVPTLAQQVAEKITAVDVNQIETALRDVLHHA